MTISETTDRVQAIGREFLKEFPRGWNYRHSEYRRPDGKMVFVGNASNPGFVGDDWEHHHTAATPDEARRLCREEAERKSKS